MDTLDEAHLEIARAGMSSARGDRRKGSSSLRSREHSPQANSSLRERPDRLEPLRKSGLLDNPMAPRYVKNTRCILYIVRRTQLYLDDHLWGALHARARREKTTISELVRQAVRERYLGDHQQRRVAMQGFIGSRKGRVELSNVTNEVRALRKGSRIDRLAHR